MADEVDAVSHRPDLGTPRAAIQPLRPFPEFLVAGHTLTQADVAEVWEGLARRDAWIEHYQQQEQTLNDQVQSGRGFVQQVLRSLRAPLVGFGTQDGDLSGMYHDRWVAPILALTIQPRRPVSGVTVRGWVPNDMPDGGRLSMRAGEAVVDRDLVPGLFSLSVEIAGGTEAAIPLTIEGTRWVRPEGPNRRQVVFVLQEIGLTHPINHGECDGHG